MIVKYTGNVGTNIQEPGEQYVPKGKIMEIKDKLGIIANHHKVLQERHKSLETRIAQLTAYGCVDAKEYWKDNKYLYLLYPMKKGCRKKKYIGNHPLRIKEARQKLKNFELRNKAIKTQEVVDSDIGQITDIINRLIFLCSKEDLSAKFVSDEESLGHKFYFCSRGSVESLYPKSYC